MPKGAVNEDTSLIHMALIGYESEKARIESKIEELRSRIGGHSSAPTPRAPKSLSAPAPSPAPASEEAPKRRMLSAAARKRIAAAQKKRWAEHRKKAAAEK